MEDSSINEVRKYRDYEKLIDTKKTPRQEIEYQSQPSASSKSSRKSLSHRSMNKSLINHK